MLRCLRFCLLRRTNCHIYINLESATSLITLCAHILHLNTTSILSIHGPVLIPSSSSFLGLSTSKAIVGCCTVSSRMMPGCCAIPAYPNKVQRHHTHIHTQVRRHVSLVSKPPNSVRYDMCTTCNNRTHDIEKSRPFWSSLDLESDPWDQPVSTQVSLCSQFISLLTCTYLFLYAVFSGPRIFHPFPYITYRKKRFLEQKRSKWTAELENRRLTNHVIKAIGILGLVGIHRTCRLPTILARVEEREFPLQTGKAPELRMRYHKERARLLTYLPNIGHELPLWLKDISPREHARSSPARRIFPFSFCR